MYVCMYVCMCRFQSLLYWKSLYIFVNASISEYVIINHMTLYNVRYNCEQSMRSTLFYVVRLDANVIVYSFVNWLSTSCD